MVGPLGDDDLFHGRFDQDVEGALLEGTEEKCIQKLSELAAAGVLNQDQIKEANFEAVQSTFATDTARYVRL